MIITDLSILQEWIGRRGFNNPFTVTFTLSRAAFNITSYTFVLSIRKFGASTNLLQLTQGSGITNGGASGILSIQLTAAQSTTIGDGSYFYELTYTVGGLPYGLLHGTFNNLSGNNVENENNSVSVPVNLSGTDVNLEITLASSGSAIQFQDEGSDLGNNLADTVDFVGAGVTATRVADKVTVTIPGDIYFLGYYISLAALQSAHPTADEGNYAYVDTGAGDDVINYIWDSSDNSWVESGTGGGTVTSVGGLSPLFTVANPTTTPTFTRVNQNANLVYAGPATGAAAPTFRALVAADLGTGANGSKFLRDDMTWQTISGGGDVIAGSVNTFTANNIFQPTVTTGTGATAGVQIRPNSLTSGNGLDVSSTSVTSGSLVKVTSTTTAINHTAGTNGLLSVVSSGANANSSRATIGGNFVVTNTGTTSTNVGAYFDASGATTNYAIQTGVSPILVNNARMFSVNTNNLFWGVSAGSLALSGGSGVENIGIGTNSGASLTTGNRNTYLGYNAGATQIGGFNNTFIGNAAGRLSTGSANTFIGKSAGEVNAGGASNTGVGSNALLAVTSGGTNTAVGVSSLGAITTSTGMTAVGANALGLLTSGTLNTAIGTNAAATGTGVSNLVAVGYNSAYNVTGVRNVAIGVEAMSGTGSYGSGPNTGTDNVFIGNSAGDFMQSGSQNTVIGSAAMNAANTGGDNVAVGFNTLAVTTGSYNIAIGSATSSTLSSGSNNLLIGKQLTPQSLTGDNQMSIMNAIFGTGNSATGTSISTGNIGILTAAPNSTFHVNGSLSGAYVAKTGTYTATISDYTIECTSSTFTVTLPTAVGVTGRIYYIVNSGAGTITVGTTSSQTFVNVTATPTTLTMATIGTVAVQSNGANWLKLSGL